MNQTIYCEQNLLHSSFGLYLTGAGIETARPHEAYPHTYHSSEYYFTWENGRTLSGDENQLLYILEGEGVLEFVRGRRIRLSAGSLVILHAGEWHRYRPNARTGWREAYVGFAGDFCKKILAAPFFPPPPTVLDIPTGGRFEQNLLTLIDKAHAESTTAPYSLAGDFMSLLGSVIEQTSTQRGEHAHDGAIRAIQLHIGHHLAETLDFAAIARQHGLSYALFRKAFRSYTGLAPLEYQLALRVRRAASLLKSTDRPIADIARDVGFRSPWYFSRYFRKATGISPAECRSSVRNLRKA